MAKLVRVEVLQQLHTELYAIAPSDAAALMFPLARGIDKPVGQPIGLTSQPASTPKGQQP